MQERVNIREEVARTKMVGKKTDKLPYQTLDFKI